MNRRDFCILTGGWIMALATGCVGTAQRSVIVDPKAFSSRQPIIDIGDGTVAIPGLRDHHTHTFFSAIFEGVKLIDISDCASVDALVRKLKGYADRDIIVAAGLNTTAIKRMTKTDLDEISNKVPIFIFDPSFHGGYLNSKAAQKVEELSRPYKKSIAGSLDTDGHWTEMYLYPCLGAMAERLGEENITQGILKWTIAQLKKGIVEAHELDIGDIFMLRCLVNVYEIWKQRVPHVPFIVPTVYGIPSVLGDLEKDPALRKKIEAYFGGIGVKYYADGAFGAHTACTKRPYADIDSSGSLVDTPDRLRASLQHLRQVSVRAMAIHAIGDAGIEYAFEMARTIHTALDIRTRIEHFELSGSEDILRSTRTLVDSGVLTGVSVQTPFNTDITKYKDRLGDRVRGINPVKSIVNIWGIPMNLGTDDVAGVPSMLKAVADAIAHPVEEHRISLELALRIASTGSFFTGEELATHSLVVVKSAMLDAMHRNVSAADLESNIVRVVYHGYDANEIIAKLV